jgi:hypothetical protein
MKLFGYGDSWTEGVGCLFGKDRNITDNQEKKQIRHKHSWVKHVGDYLTIESFNKGVGGTSNNVIFNNIIKDVQDGVIESGDLVIVMWSSTLRDFVPYFPGNQNINWSIHHIKKDVEVFLNSNESTNSSYNYFLREYKLFFLEELFTQDYYNIINQRYIIFLQRMFEYLKINYVFCDGFDLMIQELNKKDDMTHLIDENFYWGFKSKTLRDHLIKLNHSNIWENEESFEKISNKHPSHIGYKLISSELCSFIDNNKIIKFDTGTTTKRTIF